MRREKVRERRDSPYTCRERREQRKKERRKGTRETKRFANQGRRGAKRQAYLDDKCGSRGTKGAKFKSLVRSTFAHPIVYFARSRSARGIRGMKASAEILLLVEIKHAKLASLAEYKDLTLDSRCAKQVGDVRRCRCTFSNILKYI